MTSPMTIVSMSMSAGPPPGDPPARARRHVGGRPPRDLYRSARKRHLRVAHLRLIEGIPVRRLAARFRVSATTICAWTKAALGYPDPEAQALRARLNPA
jgi:hypothetical protein